MKQTNPGRHKEQRANIITRQHLKLKPEQYELTQKTGVNTCAPEG